MLSQQPRRESNMSSLGTVYATKRRRRNGKSIKPQPKDAQAKSNPSKRHRERLNAELDTIASLLPFEQNILSKLDRLSILRLSVSYLRTKSCFQVMHGPHEKSEGSGDHTHTHHTHRQRDLITYDHQILDGDMFLQAVNGFLVILDCDGEVFFSTHNIESYLGFHQSDIVHQSVYELVHSEDREELQRQLTWNSHLASDQIGLALQEALHGDQQCLERNFTVRFRCLLDNTSGFLRLDIRGRIKVLHGQNRKTEDMPLALFAVCTPFGPPSLLELPQKEVMYKSKHKLDLGLVSMDQRGKMLLGYSDLELANKGGYDLVHYDDLSYVACAHQELLKTGASGMIAYRLQTRDGSWQWLQTSSRLVYKNSKPDFVICTHRPLMEEEGRDLLGKRTMDFKVSYLDPGLTQSYLCDSELPQLYASRMSRRYKTQLKDFLSTCRTKKNYTNPTESAYTNYNNVYSSPAYPVDNSLYMQQNFSNLQTLYPPSYLPAENLFHYRQLGTYYTDYMAHGYVSNGYVDTPRPCIAYESTGLSKSPPDQKIYSPQIDASKYQYKTAETYPGIYGANTGLTPIEHKYADLRRDEGASLSSVSCLSPTPSTISISAAGAGIKDDNKESTFSNDTRQTVLMWGPATGSGQEYETSKKYSDLPPVTVSMEGSACKWAPATPTSTPTPGAHSTGGSPAGEGGSPQNIQQQAPPHSAHTILSSGNHVGSATPGKVGYSYPEGGEVWPHQYYPYHPYHTSQIPPEADEDMHAAIVTSDPGTQSSDITVAALS